MRSLFTYLFQSGNPICIVIALQSLWTEIISPIRNVEAVLVIKIRLIGRHGRVIPGENLGSDSGQRRRIRIAASIDETQAEIDEIIAAQQGTPEQKVPAIETRQVLRLGVEGSIVIVIDEGDVGSSRRVGGQMFDGRVRRQDPSVLVGCKAIRIVQVHLDQVLVE